MEVTTDQEVQAVLLDTMEPGEYITIQRSEGESLGKGVSLLTLNGELISEGMVVDMITAGVAEEYHSTNSYYETDDLLPHELTEEDRKLAAALVAVQLQQQQKHQQHLHTVTHHNNPPLPDVSELASLSSVNAYAIPTIAEPAPLAYSALQSFKRIGNHVKQEFINVKSEYDVDLSGESSDDAMKTSSGPRQSLPHKKRIARKLKQQGKINAIKKDASKHKVGGIKIDGTTGQLFKCELCGNKYDEQLKFFEHLKTHYEAVKQETSVAVATNTQISAPEPDNIQCLNNTIIEEFSEPEDLMEGIRGVVEETGAHLDDETETTPLPDVHNGTNLWASADVTQSLDASLNVAVATEKRNIEHSKYDTVVGERSKKKKGLKIRKAQSDELSCPECDRTFHHKNSLVYHMRSHSGERPHQCEICSKSFFAASALKVHKRLHSGDKPYKCEDCGRHFRQWGDLKYHSMSIHSEQRQFQCEYCGKDFARKYSLIVHRRIHTGEKNYRCEYCNKTFRASSYLQNHRRIHTGEKPHPCTVCGKPFRVRSDMKRHMHTHSRSRCDRLITRMTTGKTINVDHSEYHGKNVHHRSLTQNFVQELKFESPNRVVEIVSPHDNPETILPHDQITQGLEYNVINATDGTNDRDPLEAVDRTSDTL